MARIRSVKPEFWTSEQVMECSPTARLLFIGMWNFCDDSGIHPASAKTLKAEVFPGDDISVAEIQTLVDDLIANGLMMEYEVAERRYWLVTGWHHQKIEKPHYRHPKPEIRPSTDVDSPTSRQPVADRSTPEGRGEERSGMDRSKPSEERGEVNGTTEIQNGTPPPSRKGIVCGMLRRAGMSDAAPSYLPDETWDLILSKRTDEEIVEVAKAKMAVKPGIGLKYIARILMEDPEKPLTDAPGRRRTLSETRSDTYASLTGKSSQNANKGVSDAIESTAVRIAS